MRLLKTKIIFILWILSAGIALGQSLIQDDCKCPQPSVCYTETQDIKALSDQLELISQRLIVEELKDKDRQNEEIISSLNKTIEDLKEQLKKARRNKVLSKVKGVAILAGTMIVEFFTLRFLFSDNTV